MTAKEEEEDGKITVGQAWMVSYDPPNAPVRWAPRPIAQVNKLSMEAVTSWPWVT